MDDEDGYDGDDDAVAESVESDVGVLGPDYAVEVAVEELDVLLKDLGR